MMDSELFDTNDPDDDLCLKVDNPFAKNYDKWRRKEELHKLQTKYGPDATLPDSESSESESEKEVQVSEKFENDFLLTLSLLKNKDPRIYDPNFKCFNEDNKSSKVKVGNGTKHKPITIRDYERQIILKKDKLDDEDSNNENIDESQTYIEEQNQLKENLKSFLDDDDDENDDLAGLFKKRKKTQKDEEEEEHSYREWLKGQSECLKSEQEEENLNALKQFWTQPNLNEKDAFLRDYILNRRYLETDDKGYVPSYDDIVHDSDGDLSNDEDTIQQQVTFERKFNFRFEEPDPEFIKKYPRTIESSMRPQSNKRAQKRKDIKERKAEEKKKKFEEIGRMKALKLKEIQEKISKLKEITGNEELAFREEDIVDDFDPDAHDKRMKELFDENYYHEPDDRKPEFPDLDDELEIENWDNYEDEQQPTGGDNNEPHCEDEDFNMDCDYNPSIKKETSHLDEAAEPGPKRRRKKRRSKLAEILATEKPKFDPIKSDKTYAEYMDEYYKIDCEDVIGDLPCRFKYVETVPNDYGLTIEEILLADDKELNQWYSLKKSLKNKPEYQERGEVKVFKKRAENVKLKRKYLPSLFKNISEDPEDIPDIVNVSTNKKKKKKKKNKVHEDPAHLDYNSSTLGSNITSDSIMTKNKHSSNKGNIQEECLVLDLKPELKISQKNKQKKKKKNLVNGTTAVNNDQANIKLNNMKGNDHSKKNMKRSFSQVAIADIEPNVKKQKKNKNKFKTGFQSSGFHKKNNNDPLNSLTDERMKAYGLNPKKYKNFLKYKKY